MEARNLDHSWRKVDTRHFGTGARQCFAQQASAASHVEDAGACNRRSLSHELRAHRVQDMQWAKLAPRIPEPAGQRVELPNLATIGIRPGYVHL
jgi:hypothetical protein